MDDKHVVKTMDSMELGTFHFLRAGWWLLHIVSIGVVFYLGYLYGASLFR